MKIEAGDIIITKNDKYLICKEYNKIKMLSLKDYKTYVTLSNSSLEAVEYALREAYREKITKVIRNHEAECVYFEE